MPNNGTTAGTTTFGSFSSGSVQAVRFNPSTGGWFVLDESNLEPAQELAPEPISASEAVRISEARLIELQQMELLRQSLEQQRNMPISTTTRRTIERARSILGGGGAVPREEKKDRHFNQEERRTKYKPQKDTVKGESVSVDHIEVPA